MGDPAIGHQETKKAELILTSGTDAAYRLSLSCPEGWTADMPASAAVPAGSTVRIPVILTTDGAGSVLYERNILTFTAENEDGRHTLDFGIAGAAVWKVYGPFWNNCREIPEMPSWESYFPYFSDMDQVRQYHLNTFADIDREYIREDDFSAIEDQMSDTCSMLPKTVDIKTDRFHISDFIKFKGSCAVYMIRELICKEDMTVSMIIGHTAPYKLWIYGKLIDTARDCDWWTAENHHLDGVELKKGVNQVVLKAARIGDNGSFSLVFNHGTMTEHYCDFGSGI